jgi:hypothetical protein
MRKAAEELVKSISYNPHSANFFKEQANNLLKADNPGAETASLYAWHAEQEQTYWPDNPLKFVDLWPEFR